MKLNDKQINRLIRLIFDELKGQNMVSFKEDENKVKARATDIVKQNMRDEEAIDAKVNSMMDDLERQHGGEFQRYKMFPMLKKKIAQEEGFIL